MCVLEACPTRFLFSHFLQRKETILVPEALIRILELVYMEANVSNALRIAISSLYAFWIEFKTT
jgi:hypothetical protein